MKLKKTLIRALMLVLAVCLMLPMTALAATTTYIEVSIENDERGDNYYIVSDSSSIYLTEDSPLLAEVVTIINRHYRNGNLENFHSPAMRAIMDEGLAAYATGSDAAWQAYVDKYYSDVDPVAGDTGLKAILRDKESVLGDITPNVAHKISFENTVETDAKYGVTYTVTVTRYVRGTPDPKPPVLNKQDHFAYIQGYTDGTVRPNTNITREQAAAIFYRLLTDASRAEFETDVCPFPDVEDTRWSYTAICTMANAGIVNGFEDGTFRPEENITRAQFATMAARFDSDEYNGADLFPDISTHWAKEYINRSAWKGWVNGFEDGTFRPDDNITRAQAVTLINRVLNRLPESPADLLSGMITFPDNMNTNEWYYLAIQEAANSHKYVMKADGKHETWTDLLPTEVA